MLSRSSVNTDGRTHGGVLTGNGGPWPMHGPCQFRRHEGQAPNGFSAHVAGFNWGPSTDKTLNQTKVLAGSRLGWRFVHLARLRREEGLRPAGRRRAGWWRPLRQRNRSRRQAIAYGGDRAVNRSIDGSAESIDPVIEASASNDRPIDPSMAPLAPQGILKESVCAEWPPAWAGR